MYRKILIANRGEIACRIARTVRSMGMQAATVHSSADAQALHVREIGDSVLIGPGPARQSYLDIDAVVAAAKRVGADAVHPGFGFLSENAAFARACAAAGIAFIGPAPEVLEMFGDKAAAKRLATRLGIPTAGGLDAPSDDIDALLAAVAPLSLPYILKAVAGGGGKGMRVVRDAVDVRAAIEGAIREGRSAFGDGRLIAERYLSQPRHIEVQILGDGQGNVIHLYDRECTLQRRYQKVVEEAPVTSLRQTLREQLWAHAVALGQSARYLGLGTVEFAVTGDSAVFLEINPRLQVEHPVTEAVTGLDLVALQIQTVAERRLPFAQRDLAPAHGVAVQARLYAEDAAQGFLPCTGTVEVFEAPPLVRTDAGVQAGSTISAHYDPMIAKLIAHGADRPQALRQLREALAQTTVLGVTSNRAFLLALLADEAVEANRVTTEFIDAWLAARGQTAEPAEHVAAAMALWLTQSRNVARQEPGNAKAGAWFDPGLTGWRIQRGAQALAETWQASSASGKWRIGFGARTAEGGLEVQVDGQLYRVDVPEPGAAGEAHDAKAIGWQSVCVEGRVLRLRAHASARAVSALVGDEQIALDILPLHAEGVGGGAGGQGAVRAPMMGLVIGLDVALGQSVVAGQRLATMESMKMEMAINAPLAGTVAWVGCAAQARVERHQDLFHIAPPAPQAA